MTVRLLSLLLALMLCYAGFPAQALAGAATPGAQQTCDAVSETGSVEASVPADEPAPLPSDNSFPAPTEAVSDLPVVIHHGAEAPPSAATMAPPGAPKARAWCSACLDGLQRPPSATTPAA